MVKNISGCEIDFAAAVALMDDELCKANPVW